MKKTELIEALAAKTDLSKSKAASVLETFTQLITTELTKKRGGGEFSLTGIGKLSITKTRARTARNPHTGEPVKVPAGRRVRFSASKTLKDALKA